MFRYEETVPAARDVLGAEPPCDGGRELTEEPPGDAERGPAEAAPPCDTGRGLPCGADRELAEEPPDEAERDVLVVDSLCETGGCSTLFSVLY